MEQMAPESGAGVRRADVARILSPMLLFFAHVAYLAIWSTEPFFNKWIDGSFSFFLALVLCNVIRARIVATGERKGGDSATDGEGADGGSGQAPGER